MWIRLARPPPQVVGLMHDYCLVREDLDFVSDITTFKSKAAWNEDMFKGVDSKARGRSLHRVWMLSHQKTR